MTKIRNIKKRIKIENLIDFQLKVNKLLVRSRKSLFRKYGAKKCQFAIENSDGDFLEDMYVYTRQRSMCDEMLKSQQKLYTGQISKEEYIDRLNIYLQIMTSAASEINADICNLVETLGNKRSA